MCTAIGHVRFTPNSDRKNGLPHKAMSALPPKADMCGALADVRFGPIADIAVVIIRSPRPQWRLSLAAPQCRAVAPFEGLGRARIWSIAAPAGQRAWSP